MKQQNENTGWDACWAVICLAAGEASAFLSLYPTLREVPGFTREGLSMGFGLCLAATYFLMGQPCVHLLKRTCDKTKRAIYAFSKTSTKES